MSKTFSCRPARWVILAVSVLICGAVAGEAATIVFQEGVDGYSGCSDSYIGTGGYNAFLGQNFGNAPDLLFGQENFQEA